MKFTNKLKSSKAIQKLNHDKRNLCSHIRWKYETLIDLTQHRGHAVFYSILTASHGSKVYFKKRRLFISHSYQALACYNNAYFFT
jgi:hypothetical protein